MRLSTAAMLVTISTTIFGLTRGASANLVSDPGFEAGSGTSDPFWAFTQASSGSAFTYGSAGIGPHTGTSAAGFGSSGTDDEIDQVVSTTTGHKYGISFWYGDNHGAPDDLSVKFGADTVFSEVNDGAHGYVQILVTDIAKTSSTDLAFFGASPPGRVSIDDVDVEDLGAVRSVPEPPSLVLFGFGLSGLGLIRRGKTR